MSYVHWNPPTVHVRWAGQEWSAAGVFGDSRARSCTGDPPEWELLAFVKSADCWGRAFLPPGGGSG